MKNCLKTCINISPLFSLQNCHTRAAALKYFISFRFNQFHRSHPCSRRIQAPISHVTTGSPAFRLRLRLRSLLGELPNAKDSLAVRAEDSLRLLFNRSRSLSSSNMAAAIKALNAKIRSNKYLDYFCSTHFWGPASNFGIPLAAIADMSKDPEIISGPMTVALSAYSGTFMRYALAVSPANYLLFGCHAINFTSQLVQGYRYVNYWNMGGRDAAVKAREAAGQAEGKIVEAVKSVRK